MHRKRRFALLLVMILFLQPANALALNYTGSTSYTAGKYYAALTAVNLTGEPRKDIVQIARSQIGYQEGSSAVQLSGEIKGDGNYTEYGRWYGLQDMWCAMFVSWCAGMAEIPSTVIPRHAFTVEGLDKFIAWGRAYTRAQIANGIYTPKSGDIIYYKSSRNTNKTNHVGIVTAYSGTTVYTIEGNTSSAAISTNGGAVCSKSYDISNTYIVFICSPNYAAVSNHASPADKYFPVCDAGFESLYDALVSVGADGSYTYRKTIAAANGITDYSGTPEQNMYLLQLLKSGILVVPQETVTGTCTCGEAYIEHIRVGEACTQDGTAYDRCTKCGTIFNHTVLPAAGHSFDESVTENVVVVMPTARTAGYKTVKCSRCAAEQTTTIPVPTRTPGDVNEDGQLSLLDAVVLKRYLAGWTIPINLYNADVDGDDTATLSDAALLCRYIVGGWNAALL